MCTLSTKSLNVAACHPQHTAEDCCGHCLACAACAPTYNRGMAQHVIFDHAGLVQPHDCS